MTALPAPPTPRRRRRLTRALIAVTLAMLAYALLAYGVAPLFWRHFEHQKSVAGLSMVTRTPLGFPGDPINVGLEGSEADVICSMHAAGWFPADPVTLGSSLRIIGSVLLDRSYPQAPVSPLLYEGRREDLAFQKPVGGSARERHHVRFWKAVDSGDAARPIWLGAATFDRSVGFSHFTGQFTHHIGPDIDAERDLIAADLAAAGRGDATYRTSGIGPTLAGYNGGGDLYYTDGDVLFTRLVDGCAASNAAPKDLPDPPAIEAKNRFWRVLKRAAGYMF
jgi:hypothetical protein